LLAQAGDVFSLTAFLPATERRNFKLMATKKSSLSASTASSKPRNAFYAQSGGVTSVINVSAQAVIETARKYPKKIGKVYAGRNGIIGALLEDLIDTSKEPAANIKALGHTPAGAFGSCRYKLKSVEQNRREYERLIEVFKAHDIGYFFYNGGGDSADTCLKISQLSESMGYPLIAVHVPKTVDNDLPITDCSPGFGSVAKYVAVSMLEAGLDVASMCKTSTKVFVLEVMGRHAGWIAAATGLAASANMPAPQIILFPEITFDAKKFLARVDEVVKRDGYCAIGVSEGIRNAEGKFVAESGLVDAFGHSQLGGVAPVIADLVKRELKLKNHWAVADYLQRAARHIGSKTDVEQTYALGKAAVEFAVKGMNGVMPAIKRKSSKPYKWEIIAAPLTNVANHEKKMPRDFITADGFHITQKCRNYLQPLIGGEAYPPYADGLPTYVRLKNVAVKKKLGKFEL
jgi:ATP-dependent phosphofructokinase / diphosphate-dependent phosphofructokinase